MLKLIALISAKPDMSREDFIEYYETNHAPLVKRLLPMIHDYRRNFLDNNLVPRDVEHPGWDVLTELWFEDRIALHAFWARIQEPDVIAQIRADEANFLLSDRTRMLGVEEHVTAST